MQTVNNVRNTFLEFFKKHGHAVVPSSPLVPHNDPTLMFTNAGMVQFKNVFTGEEKRPYSTATSSQKCVRAGGKHNDLDNVGYTARHHTFFEMLGNFSFGDYFKENAIEYAWNCLTKDFGLAADKLYITVYHTDDEAYNIWKKLTGFSDDKIIRIPTKDNFWEMGNTGPCGPCSEIFYDHGDHVFGGLPGTKDENGDRYIEIWNLVFMQFEKMLDGTQKDLPKPSIDTGMGLERVAAVLQRVHNNYEIDMFVNLINYAENIVKVKQEGEAVFSYRVIADHLRSCSFLIADGVMPSNEGRGYVLRRIMRRAMRHAHQLGCREPLMHKLVPSLKAEMGEAYPQLGRAEKLITDVFYHEEVRFKKTLDRGLKLLGETSSSLKENDELSGDVAFKLYDTFGFPYDLTKDILRDRKISVDEDGFNKCMQEQKDRARAAWKGSGDQATEEVWFEVLDKHGVTEFLGYDLEESQGNVLEVIEENDNQLVITNQTPFYGESGGQMGDIGVLVTEDGKEFKVVDTKKKLGKLIVHIVKDGKLKVGDTLTMKVDHEYHNSLRANHSVTHIFHHALRELLGDHVVQKGSMVAADRMRFDFSNPKAVTKEELVQLERTVNKVIRKNEPVSTKLMAMEEAVEDGAMALFGEKYEEEVRVVSMDDSVELCGGTHVRNTGDIGFFKILSEGAIAAGIRRIECVTGKEAIIEAQNNNAELSEISEIMKVGKGELKERLIGLIAERKKLEKELTEAKRQLLLGSGGAEQKSESIAGVEFIGKILEEVSPKDLRNMIDSMRQGAKNSLFIAISNFEGKSSIIAAVSSDLLDKITAPDYVRVAVEAAGGKGGGGRPEIAQAGGFDYSKAEDAMNAARQKLEQDIKLSS